MERNIVKQYEKWRKLAIEDYDIVQDLKKMSNDMDQMKEAFYCDLSFGTAGLRGVIGAGTNRINIYTVGKASQGLANYVNKHRKSSVGSIAIAYDSRIKSDLFAEMAAKVCAANGIVAYLYRELMPTPCLSYAVRALKCDAGIVITASHNPSKYNGYKVYDSKGCQITTYVADEILHEIEVLDIFDDVITMDFDVAVEEGWIKFISDDIYTDFVNKVKEQSVLSIDDEINKNVAIVYSPLNGSGLKPVIRTLKESGYTNISVVKEQELPDGNFPTCPYPNPELKDAMELGIKYAQQKDADLLIATDPDCDRVGIAVKDCEGQYDLLTGNEVGILLLDYICSLRIKNGTMPEDPVFIKTIVTSEMTEKIAQHYGVKIKDVLTGFKFIGEQIGVLEDKGKVDSFILGFEESYGYLTGSYVRDKDAVNGAFMICEMFTYYKTRGISFLDKLDALYNQFGYYRNGLSSYEFEGINGQEEMKKVIAFFRKGIDKFAGISVVNTIDYSNGIEDLPRSNVLKFNLNDGSSIIIRPSGTEPKLKIYFSVKANNKESAIKKEQLLKVAIGKMIEICV